jgi:hypothetical protein
VAAGSQNSNELGLQDVLAGFEIKKATRRGKFFHELDLDSYRFMAEDGLPSPSSPKPRLGDGVKTGTMSEGLIAM